MTIMRVRASRSDSYERLCHDTAIPAFSLALRDPRRDELRDELADPRLERAIGVVYRPDTELQSHYFQAVLPAQFDEYVWFDETRRDRYAGLGPRGADRRICVTASARGVARTRIVMIERRSAHELQPTDQPAQQ